MENQAVIGIPATSLKTVKVRKRLKPYERRKLWLDRVIIWFFMLAILYPMVWVFLASLSKGDSFYLSSLFPKEISLDNYKNILQETDFVNWMKNSLIVSFSVAAIQIIITSFAAYAFSRMRFSGRKYGLMSLLILQLFPPSMTMAAVYVIAVKFGLIDNMLVLIFFLSGGSAFNIWMLKNYIDQLPKEIDEAAKIDGAGHLRIFIKVLMPLTVPMQVVIFIMTFIGAYTDFIISSIVMQSTESYTLVIGMRSFIQDHFAHWTQFSAGAMIASLPVLIVFMLLQKYIEQGLAAGAVKG
jgi:arabinogalactan oligomer/maltooligosaccharide transport system permease protein